MNLISMTDFVLEQSKIKDKYNSHDESDEYFNKCEQYAKFIKQPLTLGMFVPVDEDGNILEEPNEDNSKYYTKRVNGSFDRRLFNDDVEIYEEAKEKVLFKGFEIENIGLGSIAIRKNGWIIMRCSKVIGAKWENIDSYPDIESLVGFEIELTESAKKQIGL